MVCRAWHNNREDSGRAALNFDFPDFGRNSHHMDSHNHTCLDRKNGDLLHGDPHEGLLWDQFSGLCEDQNGGQDEGLHEGQYEDQHEGHGHEGHEGHEDLPEVMVQAVDYVENMDFVDAPRSMDVGDPHFLAGCGVLGNAGNSVGTGLDTEMGD